MIQNPIPWPNGARCACCISFDVDADSLIHAARPKDGHDRLYPISMGRYGPTVAVPRILETYARLGLRQSFFIPAWCMERYPAAVEAILAGDHEIGHHGYLHEDPTEHGSAEQAYWFDRALETHRRTTGRLPRGYRAPLYNLTPAVLDLIVSRGLRYDSSLMADDIPYLMRTPGGELVEMPVHWGSDDWPPFAHYSEIGYRMPVQPPARGLEASFAEFEAQYEAGGFWLAIWHPFLTGRLARWRVVEACSRRLCGRRRSGSPLSRRSRAYVMGLREGGRYAPRIEELPYYDKPVHLGVGAETGRG